MGLKQQVERYAKTVDCSMAIARKRVKYFDLKQKQTERASVCPTCGQAALYMVNGSYEEGYDDYVCCGECDETYDATAEYHPLHHWYDFDDVLFMAVNQDQDMVTDWDSFVTTSTAELNLTHR